MNANDSLAVVILAAGKGTRMKSTRAKVLHDVFYRPMLHHVLDAAAPLQPEKTVVVIGHQKTAVEAILSDYDVTCCEQTEQNGTGHAVLSTQAALVGFAGSVMILCGDSPLLLPEHLAEMLDAHRRRSARLTIMTTSLETPTNYGRIISSASGSVLAVVEEKDATDEQRAIREINAGIYISDAAFLFDALSRVTTDNKQGEMYLTDIVEIGVADGLSVQKYEHPHPAHVLGVNSKIELARAHREIQHRRNVALMAQGVTMLDPASISIGPDVTIGPDCHLAAQITVTGSSTIGSGCTVAPGVCIDNAAVGDNVAIGAHCVISNTTVGADQEIAPLTRI